MKLNITTFNVENLFNRYAFLDLPWENRNYEQFVQALSIVSIASRKGDLLSGPTTDIQRNNTAQAILDAQPDILAVQEIENIYTLRNFNDTYLDNYFDRVLSVDGNDLRGIDVGLLLKKGLKVEITNIRIHINDAEKGKAITRHSIPNMGYVVSGAIFSRDCLEVDIAVGSQTLTLLVNHFKAQDSDKKKSSAKRREQAERVAELVKMADRDGKLTIVLGDLNFDPKKDKKEGSLDPLLKNNKLPIMDPFPADTWTHYYVPQKEIGRLDYILPHKNINVLSTNILRKGLTTKCKQYTGERYPTIGPEHTEASDHCPTSVVIEV